MEKIKFEYFIGFIVASIIFIIELIWLPEIITIGEQNNYLLSAAILLTISYCQLNYSPSLNVIMFQLVFLIVLIMLNGVLMSLLLPTSEKLTFYEFITYDYFNYKLLIIGSGIAIVLTFVRILLNKKKKL